MNSILRISALLTVAGALSATQAGRLSEMSSLLLSQEMVPQGGGWVAGTGPAFQLALSDVESWDAIDSPNNVIIDLDMAAAAGLPSGSPISLVGIGWDVTIETVGASWLSEARVLFDNSTDSAPNAFNLRPINQAQPGTASGASGGIIDLDTQTPIGNMLLPDGILRLQFFESFDDVAGAIDAYWRSGSLTIQVTPEPASLCLLALGFLAVRRR